MCRQEMIVCCGYEKYKKERCTIFEDLLNTSDWLFK